MYAHGLYHRVSVWTSWVIHLVLLTIELVFIGYFVLDIDGRLHGVPVGYAFGLTLAYFTFTLEPIEIVLWSYHLLEPWVYLCLQIFKSLAWTGLSGVGIWVTTWSGVHPSWSKSLIYMLHGVTALSFYATLIYAAVIFHRHRKSSSYQINLGDRNSVEKRGNARLVRHRQSSTFRPASSIYEPFYQRPMSGIYGR